ncbi:MAG TPA: MarR family transcriptional regulator [Rhizomicrobium sp.]|jgi:DNA-binding MarR family transcriptional regulator|nr:MarR family transcriptional regulator [Rhizomicrobium sp.]
MTDSKQTLRLWIKLLSCSTTIEKKARQMLIDRFGTTLPRFDVMAALFREPSGLTMSELSAHLLVSNGNATAIVARLVEDGLVARSQNKSDRRVVRVKLTARGRREFRGYAAAHEAWIERLLGDLAEGEIVHLLEALGRVKTAIERSGL